VQAHHHDVPVGLNGDSIRLVFHVIPASPDKTKGRIGERTVHAAGGGKAKHLGGHVVISAWADVHYCSRQVRAIRLENAGRGWKLAAGAGDDGSTGDRGLQATGRRELRDATRIHDQDFPRGDLRQSGAAPNCRHRYRPRSAKGRLQDARGSESRQRGMERLAAADGFELGAQKDVAVVQDQKDPLGSRESDACGGKAAASEGCIGGSIGIQTLHHEFRRADIGSGCARNHDLAVRLERHGAKCSAESGGQRCDSFAVESCVQRAGIP